jgi:hypothetical protein
VSAGINARALRRSATVLQRSCWSLRRSVAARLLPRRAEPDVRDHVPATTSAATVEKVSPPPPAPATRRALPPRGPMAWEAVGTCCAACVSNTPVPVKNLRRPKIGCLGPLPTKRPSGPLSYTGSEPFLLRISPFSTQNLDLLIRPGPGVTQKYHRSQDRP